MAHSVEIKGVSYVPSNTAGNKIGYSGDYVARLAREGKIEATRVGRQWFVNPISLENFYSNANREKKIRQQKLRQARIQERKKNESKRSSAVMLSCSGATSQVFEATRNATALNAALRSGAIVLTGLLMGVIFYSAGTFGSATGSDLSDQLSVMANALIGGLKRDLSFSGSGGAWSDRGSSLPAMLPDGVSSYSNESNTSDFEVVREGVVVIPDGADAEELLKEIEASFSDEVVITRDGENDATGVITPVFKERTGDDYRFLLVPVTEAAEGSSP